MRVFVNGEAQELAEGASVADAARAIGVEADARGVAVAVDGEVVPRSELEQHSVSEGQRVEIVAAIQGGGR